MNERGEALELDGETLTIEGVTDVARNGRAVRLAQSAEARVAECRQWVDEVVARGRPIVYGANTGFGVFANVTVDSRDAARLSPQGRSARQVGRRYSGRLCAHSKEHLAPGA